MAHISVPGRPGRLIRSAAVLILTITILSMSPSLPAPLMRRAVRQGVDRYLRQYSRMDVDTGSVSRMVRSTGEFSLVTADGVFDITLVPNDVRAPVYKAEESSANGSMRRIAPNGISTYRGTVPGISGSEARFTIREDLIEGIVITPHEWYMIEPLRNYDLSAGRGEMVVYRASDVEPDSMGTCATALPEKIGKVQELVSPHALAAEAGIPQILEAGSSVSVADVATEADYEFVSAYGSSESANNAILEIMNQVDGIYRNQLSLSLRVVYQHTWATADDPYTSTAPSTMLGEFRSYWSANFSSQSYDLAHMWTGKDMDGSTIGIAYVGVACYARSYSYGISQRFNAAPGKYILTAHEIGHNFSASHTEQASPAQPDCSNTIMNSSVGTGTNFCPYSKAEITAHAAQYASCLQTESGHCDVNNDGLNNVLDLQSLANAVIGISGCPGDCDNNRDGYVNALDIQLQANIILGTATCP